MQQKWEEFYKSHNYFHLQPHDALKSFVSKCNQLNFDKTLDLGCGAGTNLLYLAERGFEVTGVDFSPSAVTNAEDLLQSKNLPGKVYVDNLFDKITTFTPGSFQSVIAINSLEYTDLETFKSTIKQIADLLTKDGIFLLVVAGKESKIEVQMDDYEKLFFEEDEISEAVSKYFDILDFSEDENKSLVLLLQKNSGH